MGHYEGTRFRILTEVSQHIISLTSPDELLENIARTVKTAFGYLHVGIGLLVGNEVVSRAEVGAFDAAYRSVRIPVGEGIWGRVAQSGETLLCPPVDGHEEAASVRSHICVPLKVQEVVIGVMSAASDREHAFDESDRVILQTLANQTSVAIENVHLHEQEKRMAIVEERRRLARDLHDSVTQSLYGMGLHAQAASRELALEHPQKAAEYLAEISDTADQAMAEMRLLLDHALSIDNHRCRALNRDKGRFQIIAGIDRAVWISKHGELRLEQLRVFANARGLSPRITSISAPAAWKSLYSRPNWATCERHCMQLRSRSKKRTTSDLPW